MQTIKLEELPDVYTRSSVVLVDVRPSQEFDDAHIPGSINIPLDQLRDRIGEIPRDKSVYVVCERGGQSIGATLVLAGLGIKVCCVTAGGVKHWKEKGLPISKT